MKLTTTCIIAAAACLAASAASAQALNRKAISYMMAKTIAEGAIANCAEKKYPISVVVVDAAGQTLAALRADGASPHTMENARRKAYTAMTFKQPTSAYAKKWADNDPTVRQQATLPNVIAIGGGLPIKIGDEVIGGGGVSGSPGVDDVCLQAGIDKVAGDLK